MHIKNARVFIGKAFENTDISFESTVTALGECAESRDTIDAAGCYVIPGLVDIHTHGAVGEDFSDGKQDAMQKLSDYYASQGVTSYLAATMTLKEELLTPVMRVVRDFKRSRGAKCAGIHLEGPFLSCKKRGAQAADNLHRPDTDMFHRLNEQSGGNVRIITVAPEEDGCIDFIRETSKICTVSLGHTTADYETAMEAFSAGATHATHLFNAMEPFLHREPGVVGAAMDSGASAELICDGLHIHPSMIRAVNRLFGDRLNLISDSLRCAKMPDGDYTLGGQPIVVKDGRATLLDGTLAGSSISLLDAMRNAVSFGLTLEEAVYASSTAPAMAVKADDIGSIEIGKAADLLILDKELRIVDVFIDGVRVCSNSRP